MFFAEHFSNFEGKFIFAILTLIRKYFFRKIFQNWLIAKINSRIFFTNLVKILVFT